MKFYVDRIEDGIAVLEDAAQERLRVPVADLPEGTREGSSLFFRDGGYVLDSEDERARRHKMFLLLQDMKKAPQ